MSKSKSQGTKWETEVVKRANSRTSLRAERLAEGGKNDVGDVLIRVPNGYIFADLAVLAWKRLVKTGKQKRQPDGEPDVVILTLDDFLWLLNLSQVSAIVECKATERLNVTRVLRKARQKAGLA